MIGTGTLVNMGAIIAGSLVGQLLKGGLPDRFHKTILQGIGLATIFVGISGALAAMLRPEGGELQSQYVMGMVLAIVIGSLIGEWIDIERRMESLGNLIQSRMRSFSQNQNFVEGFVSASLLYCVGAMAIVGSLEDGLTGSANTLYIKAILDGTIAIIFAATLGNGVLFAAIPVGIYQGTITLLATVLSPVLSATLINQISLVGSVLISAIGINMLWGMKIKIGNMLPAVFMPPLFNWLLSIWPF
jgi:uncharacterized membrane protein YqgA involved in biofilm formation